jgi:predicted anti-sigma-YlaC factor YlaD
MGCEWYREALSARIDGEEMPADRAQVDAHVAACADCRRWYDDAIAVTNEVRDNLSRRAGQPPGPPRHGPAERGG